MITHFQRAIHRHSRWIFLILLGIILAAFIFWDFAGVSPRGRAIAEGPSSRVILGRRLNARELEVARRIQELKYTMSRGGQVTAKIAKMLGEQSLEQIALVEKASQMGIKVDETEVLEEAKRIFSRQGQYDPALYNHFVGEILPARSLTEANLESMIRDDIMVRKLFVLVDSTAKVTDPQVKAFAAEVTEKITPSIFRFPSKDYVAQVKVTDEDVQKYFNDHKENFRIPEKRRVAYVEFPIQTDKVNPADPELQQVYDANKEYFKTADGKQKTMKDVMEILRRQVAAQKARKEATEFTVSIVPEDGKKVPTFEEMAATRNMVVKQTGLFGAMESVPGIGSPYISSAAFRLNEVNLNSDPVDGEKSIFVLHLLETKASELPALEQVKVTVKTALVESRSLELANAAASARRQEIASLLAQGKTLDQISAQLKFKPQTGQTFSLSENLPPDPKESAIRRIAHRLPAGAISEVSPSNDGVFFLYINSRIKGKSEEVAAMEPQVRQMLLSSQQQQLQQDFHRSVIKEARLTVSPASSLAEFEE